MKKSQRIVSLFVLFACSIIGVSAQTQKQTYIINDRQVGLVLQRLDRSSSRFRNSLNLTLINVRVDQTSPQNDINTFEPDFEQAINEFKERFTRHDAAAADVENVLTKAALINGFMTRNRLSPKVQTDWTSVRGDLNALATAYGVSWQWNRQLPAVNSRRLTRLSKPDLNQLIRRIEVGTDRFSSSIGEAFNESRYDRTRSEGSMNDAVLGFKKATDQLRNHFDARELVVGDVVSVLQKATLLDRFMSNNLVTDRAQRDWSTLRTELDTLGTAYEVGPKWGSALPSQTGFRANRLTGTFRLDPSRSDNPRDKAERATRNLSDNERQNVYNQILTRLESPAMLAIERRGATMTIASSLAPQATFEADGRERQEQLANGSSTRVTATLRGDQLVVSSNGYRENDFNVTFDASENSHSLRVRRQIYSAQLSQPVVVDSIYDRTADAAQWNVQNDSRPYLSNAHPVIGDLIVQDGEVVVAVLNDDLTTKQAKQGDRFTMTVREPGQYEGAVIEGTVSSVNEGGRLTGRSGMSLNFDTIQLRNGQTYRFAGLLTSVRATNGDTIKVDNEGSAQGNNQTKSTVQRASIGTAVGAIVGAIAGGGKGAAIGAIIGAAGGAGSVYVQDKDNLELLKGTELTIRSSGPR